MAERGGLMLVRAPAEGSERLESTRSEATGVAIACRLRRRFRH